VTRVIVEAKLPQAYDFMRKQVEKGRQCFVVYPLVGQSEAVDAKAAEEMFADLQQGEFRQQRLGLLHGQMPNDEKNRIMASFRKGDIDILISTTIVEVGVDVPNANVMLIENAERFGLAQLHQLRGRIGRGGYKSYCILQGNPKTRESWKRLKVMEETIDGFRIAEEDLAIRGMGNLLGKEQSGFPVLKVGDPVADVDILKAARTEAFRVLKDDPKLESPKYDGLKQKAKALYRNVGGYLSVG
jgi:ATP-dependent DNA helicase RecG